MLVILLIRVDVNRLAMLVTNFEKPPDALMKPYVLWVSRMIVSLRKSYE
jgi:hypothetical protein